MKVGCKLFFGKEETPPKEKIEESVVLEPQKEPLKYAALREFLKTPSFFKYPNVFSSDNSLKSCYIYGDMNALIELTKETNQALILDEKFEGFENWMSKREPGLIRTLFILQNGKVADHQKAIYSLRTETLRLIDSFQIRSEYKRLGHFTGPNLYSADVVLNDIDMFFKELYDDYRESNLP